MNQLKLFTNAIIHSVFSNNLQAVSAIEFKKQMKRQFDLVEKTIQKDGKRLRVYQYDDSTTN